MFNLKLSSRNFYDQTAKQYASFIFYIIREVLFNPAYEYDEITDSDLFEWSNRYTMFINNILKREGFPNKNNFPIHGIRLFFRKSKKSFDVSGNAGQDRNGNFWLQINIFLSKPLQKTDYNDFYKKLSSTIRHELEHYKQVHMNFSKNLSMPKGYGTQLNLEFHRADDNSFYLKVINKETIEKYLIDPYEVDAFVQEAYFNLKNDKSKKSTLFFQLKILLDEVMQKNLIESIMKEHYIVNSSDLEFLINIYSHVLQLWFERGIELLSKFVPKQRLGIISIPEFVDLSKIINKNHEGEI